MEFGPVKSGAIDEGADAPDGRGLPIPGSQRSGHQVAQLRGRSKVTSCISKTTVPGASWILTTVP